MTLGMHLWSLVEVQSWGPMGAGLNELKVTEETRMVDLCAMSCVRRKEMQLCKRTGLYVWGKILQLLLRVEPFLLTPLTQPCVRVIQGEGWKRLGVVVGEGRGMPPCTVRC
jgi:hypothetical protein